MPFLRFSRDERGYENTYVLHGFRGSGDAGPRLLYWFRTPPNVKVGRLPLDEAAIRAIEESNPDLTFDWTKMLKVRTKAPAAEPARPSSRRSRAARASAAKAPREDGRARSAKAAREASDPREAPAAGIAPANGGEPAPRHPVAALVGDDGLARLRAQFAELRARVAEKQVAATVREELEARVEALNPDAWGAGEPAVRAVERFEADAEEMRKTLGRRSRRRRGGTGRGRSSRSGAGAGRRRTGDASESP